MASFREISLTPAEFARLAYLDKNEVDKLEKQGTIQTIRKKVGNVDRKMIPLEIIQGYFSRARAGAIGRHGDRPENQNTQINDGVDVEAMAQTKAIPSNPNHKVQMFYNIKGGTGKSTITAQYVMNAALMGYRVLAIDLDGQGHLSLNLDMLDAHEHPTIYDVLINDLPMQNAIVNVAPGLDLVPANLGLCTIEIPLNQKARREYRLSEAIQTVADQYDLIVADTNPAASILNSSMLVASGLVNVVCATNPLSFHGMSLVMATIEELEREFKHQLEVRIIPNMYDSREVISQEVLGELKSQFTDICTNAVISRSTDLNEATKRRTTVWDVNSRGMGAQDIGALTLELLKA